MRWLLSLIQSFFGSRRNGVDRHGLFEMYFDESNSRGRRKPNRERS